MSLPHVASPEDRTSALAAVHDDVARSAVTPSTSGAGAGPRAWLDDWDAAHGMSVVEKPLEQLDGWAFDDDGAALRHRSGGFFSIVGLDVHLSDAPVAHWQQPIIDQPEVGILGFLVTRVDGVLRVLMQAKNEPGNPRGSQLSPTVQATRSNYLGLHGGRPVPYLEHFRRRTDESALADVRQSEHGSWFIAKRNRNMIVEVADDLEVIDGFAWFTLADVYRALREPVMVNMDARTVLACMPFAGVGPGDPPGAEHDAVGSSLARSFSGRHGSVHSTPDLLAAVTDARVSLDLSRRQVSLSGLTGWERRDGRITHRTGAYFDVLGVEVSCSGREVGAWDQPMIAGSAGAVAAFLAADVDGVLHVLLRLRSEAGFVDVVELGPTVQCAPANYAHLPDGARPRFLDEVLDAADGPDSDDVLFDSSLAEEGGRFHSTTIRYLVVHTHAFEEPPGYRWLTLAQLGDLVHHSHYVSVQARTLLLAAQSVLTLGRAAHRVAS